MLSVSDPFTRCQMHSFDMNGDMEALRPASTNGVGAFRLMNIFSSD